MKAGKEFGTEYKKPPFGISLFLTDKGGYSSVFVAVALLVSICLVFSLASVQWVESKASETQAVADASALAAENVVAMYSTIAQLLDASILSMGLVGVISMAAGILLSAIPILNTAAEPVLHFSKQVFDARRQFADSAIKGLLKLEQALPALMMANAASTASANSTPEHQIYALALPYPKQSQSNLSALQDSINPDEAIKAAEELQEASKKKEEADQRMRAAKERAWRADNVDDPMCLQSRAASLAGLSAAQNPIYANPVSWKFSYAHIRAKNYFLQRSKNNQLNGNSVDERQRKAARDEYYRFAYEMLSQEVLIETESQISLPLQELPHTEEQIRATRLYTDPIWPCSDEAGEHLLHYGADCPNFKGNSLGLFSLADIDAGRVSRCPVCKMDAKAMGNVASASTNINNGFEFYYRIVVEEAARYQQAWEDSKAAEEEMRSAAEKNLSAFDEAIKQLGVKRPSLCPPGAFGAIAIAYREGQTIPTQLTGPFLSSKELPDGVAISGACLAPDNNTDNQNVLASLFDGFSREGLAGLGVDLLSGIGDLWGKLLLGYGKGFAELSDVANSYLDKVATLFGEDVASWLKSKLVTLIQAAGLEPGDMRLRKPVLVNTQKILDRAGHSKFGELRSYLLRLNGSFDDMVTQSLDFLLEIYGGEQITIAELPIPGQDGKNIPLTITIGELIGALR